MSRNPYCMGYCMGSTPTPVDPQHTVLRTKGIGNRIHHLILLRIHIRAVDEGTGEALCPLPLHHRLCRRLVVVREPRPGFGVTAIGTGGGEVADGALCMVVVERGWLGGLFV